MVKVAWDKMTAEDLNTTPEKLLDALKQMRRITGSTAFNIYPMTPFFRDLLDRKFDQVTNLQNSIAGR